MFSTAYEQHTQWRTFFVVRSADYGDTMFIMDNEIEVRKMNEALKLYANTHTLLDKSNWMLRSKYPLDFWTIRNRNIKFTPRKNAKLLSFATVAGSGVVPLFGSLALSSASMNDAVGFAIAGMATIPLLFEGCKRFTNSCRLYTSMHSDNVDKQSYYANRVLNFLLKNRYDSPLFDNPYLLGYTLWFNNEADNVKESHGERAYRKFFKKVNIQDFMDDDWYAIFLEISRSMSSDVSLRRLVVVKQSEDNSPNGEVYSDPIDFRVAREKQKQERDFLALNRKRWENKQWGESERIRLDNERKQDLRLIAKNSKNINQDFSVDIKILKEVEHEWISTQSDIVQLLKYPMFSDAREPLVQSFQTKLSIAQSLMSKTKNRDFIVAVSDLKTAWSALVHEAHRVELSKFDDGERKKILLAKNLMNIALNSASTPSERQSAYKKAMEQLKGLVVLPESVRAVLEQSMSRNELVA